MHEISISYLTENQELINKVQDFISEWNSESEYILSKTSGSTGVPKVIRLPKNLLRSSAHMTGDYFKFQKGQVILLSLSIDTIGGKMIVIRALEYGMNIVVTDLTKNPLLHLETPVYFASLVPYQVQEILENTPKKFKLISNVLIGGAPISQKTLKQLKHSSTNFFESFGMTETMSHIAIKKISSKYGLFEAVGKTHFSVQNECLVIHAPDLDIKRLQTNDEIELHSSTQFVWLGRKDFVINSGGYKFHPELIESKLEPLFTFRFFIHKESDEKLGERIILLVEQEYEKQLKEKIKTILSIKLSTYEIPKQIYFIPTFIETASGKINRISTYFSFKKDE